MFNRHGYFQSRFSCRCGAHHVFNHNHKSYEKKMVEMLGGEGFDVIIEHLANINLGHDVQMLKNGARIMVVGCRGSVNINPRKYSSDAARFSNPGGQAVMRWAYSAPLVGIGLTETPNSG